MAAEFGAGRPGDGFHRGKGGGVAELHGAGKVVLVSFVGLALQFLVALQAQGTAPQGLLDVQVQGIFPGLELVVLALGFKENAHVHAQEHFRTGGLGELVHAGKGHDGLGNGKGP